MSEQDEPGDGDGFPFRIDPVSLTSGSTRHGGIMFMPRRPMTIGAEWLERVADVNTVNVAERRLIDAARMSRGRLVLFRARADDGRRLWTFDPEMDDKALEHAGQVMSRALLPLHRRFAAVGITLIVHTGWELRECYGMRRGAESLRDERSGSNTPLGRLDAWLLRNMIVHLSLSYDHVVREVLPGHLSMVERRAATVRDLIEAVPKSRIS